LRASPISLKGVDVVVSYSSGIADISPADSNIEDMIDRAGEQLNNAITEGRDRDSLLPA
jgi:PleD family two-component response regulator